jgi:hypothetical protein
MSKTIELTGTKNGTDYINVNCIANGASVAKFATGIKVLKAMTDNDFLGVAGKRALDAYITEHGEAIKKDAINRAVISAEKRLERAKLKAQQELANL